MKSYQSSCSCLEIVLVELSEYQWQKVISQKALIKACATSQTLWGFNGQNIRSVSSCSVLVPFLPIPRKMFMGKELCEPLFFLTGTEPHYTVGGQNGELRNGKVTSLTITWEVNMHANDQRKKGRNTGDYVYDQLEYISQSLGRGPARVQPFRVWTEARVSLGRKQELTCSPAIYMNE